VQKSARTRLARLAKAVNLKSLERRSQLLEIPFLLDIAIKKEENGFDQNVIKGYGPYSSSGDENNNHENTADEFDDELLF
jgi:hypothetical protein